MDDEETAAPIRGTYLGRPLGIVYRADMLVEDRVLIEVKAVQGIEPVHIAPVLSYLRLSPCVSASC